MKAITVKQPWAWAISHGPKRIENRSWRHFYRGQIAIHAGKAWDDDGEDSLLVQRAWSLAGEAPGDLQPGYPRIAAGAIVAVAELVDICNGLVDSPTLTAPCECDGWAALGQYHWRLADVRPLAEPIPCRGALGLWPVWPEIAMAVHAAVGGDR